jgi:hypothetical protein
MGDEPEWISPEEASKIFGGNPSRSTVYRSLQDPDRANRWWGPGNWRVRPLTERREVRRARVVELAASGESLGDAGGDPSPTAG